MYSAKEAAEKTGLTTAALRYYEKEELLPPISRTDGNYRQYSETDIRWISMIQCLRAANVPVQSLKKYMRLLRQGGETIPQRRLMVQEYADVLRSQMAGLQKALDLAGKKLAFYDMLLQMPETQSLTCMEEWEMFGEGET